MQADLPQAQSFLKLDQEANLVLIKILQTAGLRGECLAPSPKYHLIKAQPGRAHIRCLGIAQNKVRAYD